MHPLRTRALVLLLSESSAQVDCSFSEWGDWLEGTGCSGLMFRHRAIQTENNHCGLPCFGNKIESKRKPEESDDCRLAL